MTFALPFRVTLRDDPFPRTSPIPSRNSPGPIHTYLQRERTTFIPVVPTANSQTGSARVECSAHHCTRAWMLASICYRLRSMAHSVRGAQHVAEALAPRTSRDTTHSDIAHTSSSSSFA